MQIGYGGYLKDDFDWEKWYEWKKWIGWLSDFDVVEKEPYYNSSFKPYPLQIANAIRIMENDAVFIFDEVGCGKTISAGIMAKTYLANCEDDWPKDILVITTNTIKENRQFEDDWGKIDSKILKHVSIYNNLIQSDLKKLKEEHTWGLVIIDEAHEFSNCDTARYKALKENLRANKVIFLTATPLRGGRNFDFYKDLTKAIRNREEDIDFSALDGLGSCVNGNQELICARFEPTYPITRYFKDTVKYLDIHERKERAHRVIPEIWKADQSNQKREEILIAGLKRKLDQNINSKFIIFVRHKKDAEKLQTCIEQSGIEQSGIEKPKFVDIIFADRKEMLVNYGKIDADESLPTVVIINYQIGEAGVNLPGYDHVIHWHISSDPARLEQRYGRIDRLTSKAEKIYSIFIAAGEGDVNQSNFFDAISYTMRDLLTTLPARNVLLTQDTLSYYKGIMESNCKKSLEELKFGLDLLKGSKIDTLNKREIIRWCIDDNNKGVDKGYLKNIYPIIRDMIEKKQEEIYEDDAKIDQLIEELINKLDKKVAIRSNKKIVDEVAEKFTACIKMIEADSDKIFYMTEEQNPEKLKTIGAQGEKNGCASLIEKEKEYIMLRELIKLMESSAIVKVYDYYLESGWH